MRKIVFILLAGLFLVGCSDTSDEVEEPETVKVHSVDAIAEEPELETDEFGIILGLEEFVNEYNIQAERLNNENNDIPHLKLIDINFAESTFDESESWHNVLSDTDELSSYGLELAYDDNMNIATYHVAMSADDGHSHFQSAGIASAAVIAEILKLDLSMYQENLMQSIETDGTHKYQEAGYEIMFMDLGAGESGTLIFEFRRLE